MVVLEMAARADPYICSETLRRWEVAKEKLQQEQ